MPAPIVFVFSTECGSTTYYFDTKTLYPFLEKMVSIMSANTPEYGADVKLDYASLDRVYHLCAILMNDTLVLDDVLNEHYDWQNNLLKHYKRLIGDFPFPQELLEELAQDPDSFVSKEFKCSVVRKGTEVDELRLFVAQIG